MTPEEAQLEGLRRIVGDLRVFCAHCLRIKSKDGSIVPFMWNRAQIYLHERLEAQLKEMGRVRALLLKGRQQGGSTYVAGRFYHKTTTLRGQSAFIVAHEQKATDNLYGMVKRYHDHNPLAPSTGATNAKELIFDRLDGGYKLATAGSKDVGRSNTAQLLHGCLAPDSLIICGETGRLKRMDDFRLGDIVRTHTGARAPVSVISRQRKELLTVVMRTVSSMPLRATAEHKVWTRQGMRKLGELAPGDEIGFPRERIKDNEVWVDFAQPAIDRPQGGGSVESVPDKVLLNYDIGRILGLYLAEGSVSLQSTSGAPAAVTFAVHEKEVDRTTSWMAPLAGMVTSGTVYAHKGSKTRAITYYGKSFATFVAGMCGRVDEKIVPTCWREAGPEFARGLLHGYLCGDGHFSPSRDRRITATSIRPSISVVMRDIMLALGYGWASIDRRAAGVRHGRNEREAFVLRLSGRGVERLSIECDKPFVPSQRAAGGGRHGSSIEGDYVWLKIESISSPEIGDVMDFEVDHPDHSYCTLQGAVSNSEFGFWANAQSHLAGIGNTIGDQDGSEIILESTANGIGNAFHLMWQEAEAGRGDYIPIFIPWFWQDEYRSKVRPDLALTPDEELYMRAYGLSLEQMQWRANKIASYGEGYAWLFDQEYPATPALAFRSSTKNPLISPLYTSAATMSRIFDDNAPIVIGCDPAGDGASSDDRTAIVFRQGRVVFRVEYHEKLNTMQIAGKLAEYWLHGVEFRGRRVWPDGIIIDKGGLGAGIYDRLQELNIPVIGIMYGGAADDAELYANKKAEIWHRMLAWFQDEPVRIPNDAQFISDITAPQPDVSSNGRKAIEKKEDLAKRQVRSPDGGDALANTFAVAVTRRIAGADGFRPYQAPTSAGY